MWCLSGWGAYAATIPVTNIVGGATSPRF
ncbi:hypothetical protein XFF7766_700002 [Xanthomonas citri pv. fuscans]|nr:hypothetical protein XFF6960_1040002 [Xanthomonas citri pv. fuscans]SOO15947.1 hypothetical protein XFF7766_700002 [Xanthomonas citri pv. fuscans]